MCPKCYFEVKINNDDKIYNLHLQFGLMPTIKEVISRHFEKTKEKIEVLSRFKPFNIFINEFYEFEHENIPYLIEFDEKTKKISTDFIPIPDPPTPTTNMMKEIIALKRKLISLNKNDINFQKDSESYQQRIDELWEEIRKLG